MAEIRLENVSKRYTEDKRTMYAVREVNLTITQGEFVFLIGSSGAGKSTLLQLIGSEIYPDEGVVYLNDVNIARLIGPWRTRATRSFGIVNQQCQLIRKRTIGDNLLLAANAGFLAVLLFARHKWKAMGKLDKAYIDGFQGWKRYALLAVKLLLTAGVIWELLVGLPGVETYYPAELSIGECRRVELARALINSPPLLLLDELTANLDDDNIWDLMHLLNELNTRGTTIVMATHASQYVNIMRRRVVTLVDGRVAGDVKNGKYGDIV